MALTSASGKVRPQPAVPMLSTTVCGPPVPLQSRLRYNKVNCDLLARRVFRGSAKNGRVKVNIHVDSSSGVLSLQPAPGEACRKMERHWRDPQNRTNEGYLKVGPTQFPGFDEYNFVEAGAAHDNSVQPSFNAKIEGVEQVRFALEHLPGFREICEHVSQALCFTSANGGAPCLPRHCHLVDFDSNETRFTWHDDASDCHLSKDMVTVLVSLNRHVSAMHVWGFREHGWFARQGHALVFPGAATHASCEQIEEGCLKLALFYA